MTRFELHPLKYPANLGSSFAGEVVSVGSNVTSLRAGDRVVTLRGSDKVTDSRFGAHQKYALAEAEWSSKLLSNTSFESGAVTILNLTTVVAALSIHLGLDRPPLSGSAQPNGKKILVYGGSNPSGHLAIKYAVSAGYTVITTSSPLNHNFVQSLGPTYIIDHTASAEKIETELHQQGPYFAILDTIGLPPVTNITANYLFSIGGGGHNSLTPSLPGADPLPENVERRFASYGWAFEDPAQAEFGRWLFEEYLPKGLESGLIVPTRAQVVEQVVEGRLGNVQHALDLMAGGTVSGRKLVMYL